MQSWARSCPWNPGRGRGVVEPLHCTQAQSQGSERARALLGFAQQMRKTQRQGLVCLIITLGLGEECTQDTESPGRGQNMPTAWGPRASVGAAGVSRTRGLTCRTMHGGWGAAARPATGPLGAACQPPVGIFPSQDVFTRGDEHKGRWRVGGGFRSRSADVSFLRGHCCALTRSLCPPLRLPGEALTRLLGTQALALSVTDS